MTENAAIQRAVAAGARCIEHGHLMDVTTAKLMVEKNIWFSTQPFVSEDDTVTLTGQSRINLLQVIAGTEKVYSLAKEYKIKTAFGSNGNPIDLIDIVATPEKNLVMIMKDGEIYKNTMLTQLTKVESI